MLARNIGKVIKLGGFLAKVRRLLAKLLPFLVKVLQKLVKLIGLLAKVRGKLYKLFLVKVRMNEVHQKHNKFISNSMSP